jgi:hypothetical protein
VWILVSHLKGRTRMEDRNSWQLVFCGDNSGWMVLWEFKPERLWSVWLKDSVTGWGRIILAEIFCEWKGRNHFGWRPLWLGGEELFWLKPSVTLRAAIILADGLCDWEGRNHFGWRPLWLGGEEPFWLKAFIIGVPGPNYNLAFAIQVRKSINTSVRLQRAPYT